MRVVYWFSFIPGANPLIILYCIATILRRFLHVSLLFDQEMKNVLEFFKVLNQ